MGATDHHEGAAFTFTHLSCITHGYHVSLNDFAFPNVTM